MKVDHIFFIYIILLISANFIYSMEKEEKCRSVYGENFLAFIRNHNVFSKYFMQEDEIGKFLTSYAKFSEKYKERINKINVCSSNVKAELEKVRVNRQEFYFTDDELKEQNCILNDFFKHIVSSDKITQNDILANFIINIMPFLEEIVKNLEYKKNNHIKIIIVKDAQSGKNFKYKFKPFSDNHTGMKLFEEIHDRFSEKKEESRSNEIGVFCGDTCGKALEVLQAQVCVNELQEMEKKFEKDENSLQKKILMEKKLLCQEVALKKTLALFIVEIIFGLFNKYKEDKGLIKSVCDYRILMSLGNHELSTLIHKDINEILKAKIEEEAISTASKIYMPAEDENENEQKINENENQIYDILGCIFNIFPTEINVLEKKEEEYNLSTFSHSGGTFPVSVLNDQRKEVVTNDSLKVIDVYYAQNSESIQQWFEGKKKKIETEKQNIIKRKKTIQKCNLFNFISYFTNQDQMLNQTLDLVERVEKGIKKAMEWSFHLHLWCDFMKNLIPNNIQEADFLLIECDNGRGLQCKKGINAMLMLFHEMRLDYLNAFVNDPTVKIGEEIKLIFGHQHDDKCLEKLFFENGFYPKNYFIFNDNYTRCIQIVFLPPDYIGNQFTIKNIILQQKLMDDTIEAVNKKQKNNVGKKEKKVEEIMLNILIDNKKNQEKVDKEIEEFVGLECQKNMFKSELDALSSVFKGLLVGIGCCGVAFLNQGIKRLLPFTASFFSIMPLGSYVCSSDNTIMKFLGFSVDNSRSNSMLFAFYTLGSLGLSYAGINFYNRSKIKKKLFDLKGITNKVLESFVNNRKKLEENKENMFNLLRTVN